MSAGKLIKKGSGFALLEEGKKGLLFPKPLLPGRHQVNNAALAVLTARELAKLGFKTSHEAVLEGVENCRWRGRLEKVSSSPDVYLDGAHNMDGIRTLKGFTAELKGKKVLVFGAMKDKPFEKMAAILAPCFEEVVLTEIPMERAAKKDHFQGLLKEDKSSFVRDPIKALGKAKRRAGKNGVVVAPGSLYLVGYLLKHLEKKEGTAWGTGL